MSQTQDVGTFRRYADKRLRGEKLELVGLVAQIAEQYESAGDPLTVRQIYYRLVEHHGYPNRRGAYDAVQSAVNDGRMAGLVSWTAIEDRGRNLYGLHTHESVPAALRGVAREYRRDLWRGQHWRPEVWIEKQALEGVISSICNKLRVDFYATKGYNSQSEAWSAGRRFAARMQRGQRTVVIHLGDHDPSGVDMTRDNRDRLSLFAGYPVTVVRIALNMDQVEAYSIPQNPDNLPKETDSRTRAYVEQYGNCGWELDALEPATIRHLIEQEVGKWRDPALWDEALAEEVDDRRELRELSGEQGGAD